MEYEIAKYAYTYASLPQQQQDTKVLSQPGSCIVIQISTTFINNFDKLVTRACGKKEGGSQQMGV